MQRLFLLSTKIIFYVIMSTMKLLSMSCYSCYLRAFLWRDDLGNERFCIIIIFIWSPFGTNCMFTVCRYLCLICLVLYYIAWCLLYILCILICKQTFMAFLYLDLIYILVFHFFSCKYIFFDLGNCQLFLHLPYLKYFVKEL